MNAVAPKDSDLAWLIYDLEHDKTQNRYRLVKGETVYTKFAPTMLQITTAEPGPVEGFIETLQAKLDDKLELNPPDAPTLGEALLT